MLDSANGGPEPDADILRAILHGVAAGACQVAARETSSAYWAGMAQDQRKKADVLLHQAASASRALIDFSESRRASAREDSSS